MKRGTTTAAQASAGVQNVKDAADVRGFWRILLAVIAPLPLLAKGVFYLLVPVDGDATYADTVAAFTTHQGLLGTLELLDVVFVVGLIPATLAVAWVARRGAPRLTTCGAVTALGGFFAGIALLGGVQTPALMTVQYRLDVNAMAAADQALHTDPLVGVAAVLFLIGIVVGLGLLGVALWRSRSAPAWMGIALMVGGATHPFIPGHIAQGIGLLVAAAGYAGASLALLRMGNKDFDLPSFRPAANP